MVWLSCFKILKITLVMYLQDICNRTQVIVKTIQGFNYKVTKLSILSIRKKYDVNCIGGAV